MDLPDCPPGTEGYEDDGPELSCPEDATKGEREFAEYLHGLKLPLENGTTGRVLEQRTRDQSGQLVYACYPCSVTLYGEYMAKTHLDGRKHISKLESRKVWPKAIYDNHPIENMGTKIETAVVQKPVGQTTQPAAAPAPPPQANEFRFDLTVVCRIQTDLDSFRSNPLIGLEYLVEILPKEEHHAPMYCCVLCSKTGHNSTMLNHLICMHHNFRYISVHFKAMYFAIKEIKPIRAAFQNVMDSLMRAIEESYGRMRPVQCTQIQWETHNAAVSRAVTRREHVSELMGKTFLEILDPKLMQHLSKGDSKPFTDKSDDKNPEVEQKKKDPSPPKVAAPSRPANYRSRKEHASPARKVREGSLGALSNVSSEHSPDKNHSTGRSYRDQGDHHSKYSYGHDSHRGWSHRGRGGRGGGYRPDYDNRYKPNPYHFDNRKKERYGDAPHGVVRRRSRSRSPPLEDESSDAPMSVGDRRKLDFKLIKYKEKTQGELDNALKVLAYHEKNPEKHPQYPEEWKKFWNRRYKEVKTENKDPTTYDFKPEWIIFWTKRMVELHEEQMAGKKRIFRKQLGFSLDTSPTRDPPTSKPSRPRSRSPRWRPPSAGRRSRSPLPRRRSPLAGRLSPHRRNPSPGYGPIPRTRKISTPRDLRDTRNSKPRDDFRLSSSRDKLRPQKERESRSKSPFSARVSKNSPDRLASRNRSPQPVRGAEDLSPMSLSDGDNPKLKSNALSPWGDSSSSLESVRSVKRNSSPRRGPSPASRRPPPSARYEPPTARYEPPKVLNKPPASTGPEDVVPVLRLLAALEDYLGPSLGPKIMDILGEALKMEKEKPNSSENILDVDEHTSVLEMCKEKLKGKVEAGLVGTAATVAAREVISRTAALLHLSEKRKQERKKEEMEAVRVKGVGAVDKAAVARQLAAALIAQGKTDVTTEELATLVDAVVGMAEAKRRAGEAQKPISLANILEKSPHKEPENSGLKMLQAAYEEQHKPEAKVVQAKPLEPVEEVNPVDAMDGLSDSDLKTLMQNFKDLSTDEQEGLVAYLKKLEVRDPKRVENLRQFVDFGSENTTAPPPAKLATTITKMAVAPTKMTTNERGQANVTTRAEPANVSLIDSDDDDYTVEEVFKSAVKKVKEDIKQKEMEVVQKSLQHSKPEQNIEAENVPRTTEEPSSSKQADTSRLLKLVQSTAGRGLFNAFSTQSSTPSNTSNTGLDTQAKGAANNVTASNWLAQSHNDDASGMTDSAGWEQNMQTEAYGDVQDSNSQSENQFSNQDADDYVEAQSVSGMRDTYQNQNMLYKQPEEYPLQKSFQHENFSLQNQRSQQGNFSMQNQLPQQGNFPLQNQLPQQGNFQLQNQSPQQGNFSQQDQFQRQGNLARQDPFSDHGNFSQQDPISQQENFSQDQFSQQGNLSQQDQFIQQRNFSQRTDFTQDNFSQQNPFLQQRNNFAPPEQYSKDNLGQQGPYPRQGEFSQDDHFSQQGNFPPRQFPRAEIQSRMGGNNNFNNRDQFQGGPQYQGGPQGGPIGGYQANDRNFGGPARGRGTGGRGRGRGGGRGGRGGQFPY